jgi:hypothetical protein
MKPMMKYTAMAILSLALSSIWAQDSTRQTTGKASVNTSVTQQEFTFTAESATPLGGRYIILNYPYSFKITGDSIQCYLPYYGRAYIAPYSPQDGPLTFTSTDFIYQVTKSDGKKQELTIETKDRTYNNKFFFTIFSNGTAQLQVTSNDRQPINFQGRITGTQAMK